MYVLQHTPKSHKVGQPSSVDIKMASGDACPTDREDLVAAALRYVFLSCISIFSSIEIVR